MAKNYPFKALKSKSCEFSGILTIIDICILALLLALCDGLNEDSAANQISCPH